MNTSGKRYRVAQGCHVLHPNGETPIKGGTLLEQGLMSEKWLESVIRDGIVVEDRNSQASIPVMAADEMPGAAKNPPLPTGGKNSDNAIDVKAKNHTSPQTVTISGPVGLGGAAPQPLKRDPAVPPTAMLPETVPPIKVEETAGAGSTVGGDPANHSGQAVGKWDVDPSKIAGFDLEKLNIMVRERDASVELFTTAAEATAWLTQHFVKK